ncbi:LysM peptidoglycan-binding domain-containing protein [Vibrio hippocampi]|uniref:Membrane-bound lytic murein transglycosylase D n=1 Tax=Vibrio hippocampi TaxID=654686 RepID=A0ABN8DDC8_9VIBR|nr:LysM peptidoglycan-binding domain-containing protein [Vibrio hippocampi]CAH0524964.1 Membrane-bound lytic murein transglycosylase D [Vibrio hippocampi]
MHKKHSWALALLLAGCQLTQPESSSTTTEPTNSPAETVSTTPPVSAPSDTAEIKDDKTQSAIKEVKKTTPQDQEDVWQRIAMQLEMQIPDNKKVDYYRKWYIKHPQHLKTVSERAKPFLYLITEEIEARGLPMELALLPVVESSFDAFAYSHGSAAGLWQFVPATGKAFGLEQTYWYDGRRDVTASTEAALDYLTQLNRRFDGNWHHAIAAYNSGGGRVSSAIRKNKKAGKPTDFFSLDLPKETSSYVPKLLALADILAHRDKYGVDIPAIPNHQALATVDPQEQLDLAIAAKYAGISTKELQSYNPAYNQWATAPSGRQSLLLPVASVDNFNKELEKNRGQGLKLARYKVKSGDSLSVIAARHNTTVNVIKTANGLKNNNIRIGQHLLIPNSAHDNSSYSLTASNRLAKTQSKTQGNYKINHKVKSGESLWTIAKANKVSYQSLAKWNGMGPRDTLRIGQELVIWKSASDGAIIRTIFYSVRNGDTVSGIAHKFKVRTNDVVKWNSLEKQKYLKPGQKLKLYVDVTKTSA